MFSEKEIDELNECVSHFPQKSAAAIEALKIIQHHRGWVSDESVAELAEFLGMSSAGLDNVATFYNIILRKPVGRHVIFVCDSITCFVKGYGSILDYFREKLNIGFGETTPDNRFTLLPIPCLGTCDHAPAMMVDEDLHTDLDSDKIAQILEQYK
jgi:NADH-quinone oxidoreductase subunit E